jgi:hypothetical protein
VSRVRVYECVEGRTVELEYRDGRIQRLDFDAGDLVRVTIGSDQDKAFGPDPAFVVPPRRVFQLFHRWVRPQERNNPR